MWRKPIKAVQNLFDIKKYLALVLKKNVHVILCVFQTNLNKVVNIFCIGWESCMKNQNVIKETLLFPHTYSKCNWTVK